MRSGPIDGSSSCILRALQLKDARIARGLRRNRMAGRLFPPRLSQIIFRVQERSEEHTSELQSLMRISYAVFCLKKKKTTNTNSKPTVINKNLHLIHSIHTPKS